MATGTVNHWVSENNLKHGIDIQACVGQLYTVDDFKIKFEQKYADLCEFYTEVVREFKEKNRNAKMFIEHRVSLDHLNYPEVFGTADVVFSELFGSLIIIDLKSGKGKSVPGDAGQLKLYAIMAAGNMLPTFERIITVVVQPLDLDGEKVKIVEHKASDLKQWLDDEVIPAIESANSGNPLYKPSEEACRWCDYSGECKEQAEYAYAMVSKDFELIGDLNDINGIDIPPVLTLSNNVISQILDNEGLITKWLSSVKEVALERMMRGDDIPNYKVVNSITRRRFDPDIDVAHILYKELKLRKKDIYEQKLKSPIAILEMVEKKEDIKKRVEELIIRPPGHPKIAHVSDKRQPLKESVSEDFKDI